jgi:hypothetical protein
MSLEQHKSPIPVSVWSKAWVWSRGFESRLGNVCSYLAFFVCCVGSGLCDGLITHSEESYGGVNMCVCLIVCDLDTSTMRRLRLHLVYNEKKNSATYEARHYVTFSKFAFLLHFFLPVFAPQTLADKRHSHRCTCGLTVEADHGQDFMTMSKPGSEVAHAVTRLRVRDGGE